MLPDYADQRFYASTYGRFLTPDRFQGQAKGASDPSTPGSWNKYEYALSDPVNNNDPQGMYLPECPVDGSCWGPPCTPLTYDPGSCIPDLPAAPLPIATQPSAPPPPQCSISLDERPVPNVKGTPAYHTYMVVTDSAWTNDPSGLLLEGGPTGNPLFSSLYGFDTQPPGQGLGARTADGSDPSLPSNKQIGATYGGSLACGAVQLLLNDVNSYDAGSLVRYNFLAIPGTYNSNSFIYTLLNDLSSLAYGSILSAFGTTVPGWVPGWGKLVPGL